MRSRVLQRERTSTGGANVPARVSEALRLCMPERTRRTRRDIREVRLVLGGRAETDAPQSAAASSPQRHGGAPAVAIAAVAVAMADRRGSGFSLGRETLAPLRSRHGRFEVDGGSGAGSCFDFPRWPPRGLGRQGGAAVWVRLMEQRNLQLVPGTEGAVAPVLVAGWAIYCIFRRPETEDGGLAGCIPANVVRRTGGSRRHVESRWCHPVREP